MATITEQSCCRGTPRNCGNFGAPTKLDVFPNLAKAHLVFPQTSDSRLPLLVEAKIHQKCTCLIKIDKPKVVFVGNKQSSQPLPQSCAKAVTDVDHF